MPFVGVAASELWPRLQAVVGVVGVKPYICFIRRFQSRMFCVSERTNGIVTCAHDRINRGPVFLLFTLFIEVAA